MRYDRRETRLGAVLDGNLVDPNILERVSSVLVSLFMPTDSTSQTAEGTMFQEEAAEEGAILRTHAMFGVRSSFTPRSAAIALDVESVGELAQTC